MQKYELTCFLWSYSLWLNLLQLLVLHLYQRNHLSIEFLTGTTGIECAVIIHYVYHLNETPFECAIIR